MFDAEIADRFFDVSIEITGNPPNAFLFDKRYLLPESTLADKVRTETGHDLTSEQLRTYAAAGWFSLLPGAGDEGTENGVPLYVPTRIGMFVDLRKDGYADAELAAFAEHEEWMVDNIYTTDELTYVDDEVEEVRRAMKEKLEWIKLDLNGTLETEDTCIPITRSSLTDAERAKLANQEATATRILRFCDSVPSEAMSHSTRRELQRLAFQHRMRNDCIRTWMMERDRSKLRAGYSVNVQFKDGETFGRDGFVAGEIDWRRTLYKPDGVVQAIRVPGVILDGSQITITKTPAPQAYEKIWKELDLEEYFAIWARIAQERICPHCKTRLADDADARRRYCSDSCKEAAKQKRFRQRNPRANARAQGKYWTSVHKQP